MKIKIEYDLTEIDASDTLEHISKEAIVAACLAYNGMVDLAKRELQRIEQEALEDQRRWERFLHFCHTGKMW